MDEMGIIMFYKFNKVLVKKGVKMVYGKVFMFWELIIVIVCGNVNGDYFLFYFVIFGKIKRKLEGYDLEVIVEDGLFLRGFNFLVLDLGWIKDGIVRFWFIDIFLKNIGLVWL